MSGSIKRRGSFQSMTKLSPTPSKDSIIGQAVSTEMTLHWSPGLCGLSTPPPSQQISPSSSLAGYVSGLSQTSSQHGLQITNLQESSMNEFLSDTGLLTQSDKRSRSRAGTFSGSSTPYQSVPPSPLKMDASLFKFSGATVIGSDPFRLHSGELVAPTPPKTTRVPLSKVPHTALINLSKVAQKLEEQQQAQYRYPDKEGNTCAPFLFC